MRRHTWVLAAGAGVLVGLLVILGTLQYRWLDQVGQTIAAQKRASLVRHGTALASDLQRELTRAFYWFWLEQSEGSVSATALAERLRSWREEGRHVPLVAEVLVLQRAGDEERRTLLRLDDKGETLVAADWPAALASLRDELGYGPPGSPFRMLAGSPVLVVASMPGPRPGPPGAIVLVRLDGQYLTSSLLPVLARENLTADDGEPLVAQLRAGGEPLFAWPRDARAEALGDHDAITVAAVRLEGVDSALLEGMRPPMSRRFPFGLRVGSPGPHRGFVFWGFGGPEGPGHPGGPGPGGPPPGGPRGPGGPPPGEGPGGPPRDGPATRNRGTLTLSLGYAAGRVDQLVANLRRRNAALAFGILVLLGGAMGVLVVAVRRTQALADRRRQFMASVSHELRTPLAVIASAAENLRDGTVDGGERVREYGAMIHEESKRLHSMVDDVLRLAAGEDLEEGMHLEPLDVRDVVDAALDSFEPEIRARGGRVERSDPSEAPLVTADARALRHAVENVVGNALKYGGEPPQISIRVARVDGPGGCEVHVAVEDRGMGIPADELDHVFDPFFRGREAMKRQIRGAGLGLSLVARVLRAHGGRVTVDSTPGRGTCITLRLPCPPEEVA
jgi:signal transduction histidine kinase